ncbi:MAG: HD domain-containing protein, partial [bacterium]|nr:HD domain-containing protein [bacterium]
EAHDGQYRKGTGIPYVSHVLQVAGIALEHGADEDQAIAALLHDVVEDTHYSGADMAERFGDRVAKIVLDCSDTEDPDNKPPWRAWSCPVSVDTYPVGISVAARAACSYLIGDW